LNIRGEESMIERATYPTTGTARKHQSAHSVLHREWTEKIPDNEWAIYERAITALRTTGRPFMLAGAFSLAAYTGRWRNTKDIDFYVLPKDRTPCIEALTRAGFIDFHDKLPYVRHWIYRAWRDDCIVDIIWAMANQRAQVDEEWFERAPQIVVHGETLSVVPAEELLWCKLYVLQKDRCDWPDVLNLIHAIDGKLDWDHLADRLGEDLPLLLGLLNVYCWLCPGVGLKLPQSLRAMLPNCAQSAEPREDSCRINWLDSRPWFVPARNVS
jgi:hypothetical protein